ncbi:MAG: dienelactone hydrolase family protein [Alphaproteobacteria bacterium]
MGQTLTLSASDGHSFNAYLATPAGRPRAGLVVIQEIFGVNSHIRAVTDGFAKDGYLAIAPALFDRVQAKVDLGYDAPDIAAGREIRAKVSWDDALKDIAAAAARVRTAGKVGCVGYCWGGSLAWLAATRLDFAAAVGYYGGQVYDFRDEKPRCPIILHFGERDHGIPMEKVDAVKKAQPAMPVYVYPAGHGFSCDHRADFNAAAATLARQRTIEFLAKTL